MNPISALRAGILTTLVCGAVIASAAAAPPHGTLTPTEYKVLSKTLPAAKKALFGKHFDLTLGESLCRADGSSTALMISERMACANEFATFQQFQEVEVSVLRCQALYPGTTSSTTATTTTTTTTTTTATTTTSGQNGFSSNQLLSAACESPYYRRLTNYVASIDNSAARLRQRALQRGFSGRCVNALGASSTLIADERHFVSATKQISVDVSALADLNAGTPPAHVPSQSELTSDVLAYELALGTYVKQGRANEKLSACSHE